MKIMVIEDDPAIQDVLQLMITKAGFEVVLQPDGMVVIEGPIERPDLFIIDKQLSGVSGLDVCRYLKQNDDTSAIPIIMISASPAIAIDARNAGADGFLEKPFRQKDLLGLVRKYLKGPL